MPSKTATRLIDAPVGRVFDIISAPEKYARAVPAISKVEILSKVAAGPGVRFRETRDMNGKEASSELEITEFTRDEMVRFISDAGGVRWDSVFNVTRHGAGARLDCRMVAKPYTFAARIMTPFIMGVVAKAIEADMDAVKAYCEKRNAEG